MAIPEQIRKQSEDIQKLYADMNSEADDDTVEDVAADDVDDNAEDDGVSDNGDEGAASDTTSEHGGDDEESYAQKYRTLQGMFNSQVPQLKAEKDALAARLKNMEQLIANMNAEGGDRGQSQANTNTSTEKLVTQADVEEYGESIDVMRRVSREELGSVMATVNALNDQLLAIKSSLDNNVMPQVRNVSQQHQRNTAEQFWSRLGQAVPNWQDVNKDPDFHTWLLQIDPLTGVTRQQHLEEAQDNYDSGRVAAFFNAYTSLKGDNSQNTNAQSNRSASELEKQVAPGRSRSTQTAAGSSEPKTYTRAQIEKFYSDVQKGKYRGREKERDRTERDIFAAQQDGRIVTN